MNWLTGGQEAKESEKDKSLVQKTREIIAPPKETDKSRLLSDFKYYFDEVIFLQMTRYEFGLWLVFAIFFFLNRSLKKMGDAKTVFDFMRPA